MKLTLKDLKNLSKNSRVKQVKVTETRPYLIIKDGKVSEYMPQVEKTGGRSQ